ncbi:hypothetical protein [Streptomyces sp. UG1]|uniref:hypothetical protein n=1 Tax=Streptomyces sp. UG1 TaxID=3417652 RepID=UPI003CF2B6B4
MTPPPPPPRGRRRNRNGWVDSERGLAHLLREYGRTPRSGVWREAGQRFRAALATLERLRAERESAAAAVRGQPTAEAELRAAEEAAGRAAGRMSECRVPPHTAEQALLAAQMPLTATEAHRAAHFERRPGRRSQSVHLGASGRDRHRVDQDLAVREDEQRVVQDSARVRFEQARHAVAERSACERARDEAEARVGWLADVVARARSRWDGHVPGEHWLSDDTAREPAAPGRTRRSSVPESNSPGQSPAENCGNAHGTGRASAALGNFR